MLVLVFGSVAATTARPALAQSQEDLERARSLFRQGLSLEAAGNWAGALAKFDEVGRVKLTPQVRFHTARCNEHLGRLNEALGGYRLAEYEAGQQTSPDLAAIAQSRQALEQRIPKLVIKRGAGAETARIELDGVQLGETEIGKPMSVDPGPHRIVVKVSADRQFQQAATVKEGETQEVLLVAPASAAPEAPLSPNAPNAVGQDTGVPSTKKASVVPWIIGGVGAASLVTSGAFFLVRQSAKTELDNECRPDGTCPESLHHEQTKGALFTTLSWAALGVGVVGVGVATVWLVSGSHAHPAQAFLPVDIAALPAGGTVTVRGRF